MKTLAVFALAVSPIVALAAGPVVSDVTYTQKNSRLLKIGYKLANQPAVITVDVQTNVTGDTWASIGPANFPSLSGDVGVVVPVGDRTVLWDVRTDWPDHVVEAPKFRIEVTAWATNAPPDYMVVDLNADRGIKYYADAASVPGGVGDVRYKTTHLLMRKIPAAGVEWTMGSPTDESGRMTDERGVNWETQHKVVLSADYYMAVFETTQKQYSRYSVYHRSHPHNDHSVDGCDFGPQYDTYPLNRMFLTNFRGTDKGLGWPTNHDVDSDSWIGQLRATTGLDFDLPTEAQWEFACRAGTTTAWCDGEDAKGSPNEHIFWFGNLGQYASYNGQPLQAVGKLKSNGYGLYDIMGNVAEMCLDWSAAYATDGTVAYDPVGAAKPDPFNVSTAKVICRGGRRGGVGDLLRSACRIGADVQNWSEEIGFRLVCPAAAK